MLHSLSLGSGLGCNKDIKKLQKLHTHLRIPFYCLYVYVDMQFSSIIIEGLNVSSSDTPVVTCQLSLERTLFHRYKWVQELMLLHFICSNNNAISSYPRNTASNSAVLICSARPSTL
jgi:hypothetical protein